MLTEFWKSKGWIALIPLAIGAVAFYAWIAIGADARAMNRTGIEATATIVDTRRITRPATTGSVTRLSYNYYATVLFPTGSATDDTLQIHQTEHFVTADYYDNATVGDQVWVRYLPTDPDRIELVRGGTQSNSNAAGWFAFGMIALSMLVAVMIGLQAAKVRRFRTTGSPVQATITEIVVQNTWTILSLTLPSGRSVKAMPIRSDPGYTIGATITVLTEPRSDDLVMIPPTP